MPTRTRSLARTGSLARIESFKTKAKLLQKAKRRAGKTVQLKTCLEIIAKTAGFGSWRDLKKSVETGGERFTFPTQSAFWNVWYGSYAEARKHLEDHGGFLIPHEKHYFICDVHYIENLGIKRSDPDLEKSGNDWARPADAAAFSRILEKISARAGKKTR